MDLKSKFDFIERSAFKSTFKDSIHKEYSTEVEIINWREMFKLDLDWIKNSVLTLFDRHYQNRRREFVARGITSENIHEAYQYHKKILKILVDSGHFINSYPSKTMLYFRKDNNSYHFFIYKLVPLDKKNQSWDRISLASERLSKKLNHNKISTKIFTTHTKDKSGQQFHLFGLQINLSQITNKKTKIKIGKESTFNEKTANI